MLCYEHVEVVIGFINASYQANENDGVATLLVGVTSSPQVLQRTVSVLAVFSDGTAGGKFCTVICILITEYFVLQMAVIMMVPHS